MSEIKRNCTTCRHGLFDGCAVGVLENNTDYQKAKATRKWEKEREFKSAFICDQYKCCYIEYPLTISDIKYDTERTGLDRGKIGKFAKIRPCGKEYGNKTYLGLFLGQLPMGIHISHNEETGILNASFDENPAIFVFDLNKIVYGAESWWGIIEKESDLEEITDIDIENVWYVKALKSLEMDKTPYYCIFGTKVKVKHPNTDEWHSGEIIDGYQSCTSVKGGGLVNVKIFDDAVENNYVWFPHYKHAEYLRLDDSMEE